MNSKWTDGILIIHNPLVITHFNEFFIEVGPYLSHKIPNQVASPLYFMIQPRVNYIFLSEVTPEEMIRTLH